MAPAANAAAGLAGASSSSRRGPGAAGGWAARRAPKDANRDSCAGHRCHRSEAGEFLQPARRGAASAEPATGGLTPRSTGGRVRAAGRPCSRQQQGGAAQGGGRGGCRRRPPPAGSPGAALRAFQARPQGRGALAVAHAHTELCLAGPPSCGQVRWCGAPPLSPRHPTPPHHCHHQLASHAARWPYLTALPLLCSQGRRLHQPFDKAGAAKGGQRAGGPGAGGAVGCL